MQRPILCAEHLLLQHNDSLGFFENGSDLIGEFSAQITGGPQRPISFAAPFAQQEASVGRVCIKKRFAGNKAGGYIGAVHRLAREFFISGNHALGYIAFDKYVNHVWQFPVNGYVKISLDYTIFSGC
jgi:hypothetical protein